MRDDYAMRALGEQVSTASLARDVLAGKPSELDAQIGAMVRHAEGAGVDAPTYSLAYAALLPEAAAVIEVAPQGPRTDPGRRTRGKAGEDRGGGA